MTFIKQLSTNNPAASEAEIDPTPANCPKTPAQLKKIREESSYESVDKRIEQLKILTACDSKTVQDYDNLISALGQKGMVKEVISASEKLLSQFQPGDLVAYFKPSESHHNDSPGFTIYLERIAKDTNTSTEDKTKAMKVLGEIYRRVAYATAVKNRSEIADLEDLSNPDAKAFNAKLRYLERAKEMEMATQDYPTAIKTLEELVRLDGALGYAANPVLPEAIQVSSASHASELSDAYLANGDIENAEKALAGPYNAKTSHLSRHEILDMDPRTSLYLEVLETKLKDLRINKILAPLEQKAASLIEEGKITEAADVYRNLLAKTRQWASENQSVHFSYSKGIIYEAELKKLGY